MFDLLNSHIALLGIDGTPLPRSRYLATTSADNTVKIWNVADNFSLEKTLVGMRLFTNMSRTRLFAELRDGGTFSMRR